MNQITRADAIVVLLFFMVFFVLFDYTGEAEKGEESSEEKPKYKLREIFGFHFDWDGRDCGRGVNWL